jgi:AbiJ N-terminal domain 4
MSQTFSERMGFNPARNIVQIDSMNDALRVALWNVLFTTVWKYTQSDRDSLPGEPFRHLVDDMWTEFFKNQLHESPGRFLSVALGYIKPLFYQLKWYEIYDFLEFIAERYPNSAIPDDFTSACNLALKREHSAYRFVGKRLVPNTSELELEKIEEALTVTKAFTQHLEQAIALLSNRQSPDYANSIKESISAVEAMCQLIAGDKKATLGDALRQLDSKLGGTMHPALRAAFNSIYGYTSDAQGIRHALLGKSDLDVEDAMFMLVACSAFINYLVVKADKAGIQL